MKALRSDFFYPSNAQVIHKVKDRGNLQESLKNFFEIDSDNPLKFSTHLKDEKVPFAAKRNFCHIALKPCRFTARLAYFSAVSLLVAPAGVICHSAEALVITGKTLTYNPIKNRVSKNKVSSSDDWIRIKALGSAAFRDFKFSVFGLAPLGMVSLLIVKKGGYFHAFIGAISMLGLVGLALNPQKICYLVYKDSEREERLQSFRAKNTFGLVSETSDFLSSDNVPKNSSKSMHPLQSYQKMTAMFQVAMALKAQDLIARWNEHYQTEFTLGSEDEEELLPSISDIFAVLSLMKEKLKISDHDDDVKFNGLLDEFLGNENENLVHLHNIHNLEFLGKTADKLQSFFNYPIPTRNDHYQISWRQATLMRASLASSD